MKAEKEIKKPKTGLVLERPHATRSQRRGSLKRMPQWKEYKQLPFTHPDSIEFRNTTRERGNTINKEHQEAQEKYTEAILSEKSGKIEKVLKDLGHNKKYIDAYMDAWFDTTLNRRHNLKNGEEHRFYKILKNNLND